MPNPNYGSDLLASTFEIYMRNKAADAIFGDIVLLKWLKKHAKIRKDGGLKLLEPVLYQKSTAVGSYNGYDLLDVSPQEGLDNAEFDWKQYYLTVTISGRELALNQGKGRMINLLDTKIQQAETSLVDAMNEDLFLDGSGNNSKDVTGLAAIILASGTYGNISRTTYSWWRSNVTAVSGALAIAGASGMRRMYNDCSLGRGRMMPDGIVTTQILWEAFEALMDTNMRYNTNSNGAAIEGQSLKYKKADLFWDEMCQSGVMYFLQSKILNFVTHSDRDNGDVDSKEDRDEGDFRIESFEKPHNQDAQTAKAFWMGNLTSNNPRFLGKLTTLTNT